MTDSSSSRLLALRAEMEKAGIDALVVPSADEFRGEYTPPANKRMKWASGDFTGSAGTVVVTKDKAAFFTDGRYTLQARAQVNAQDFELCSTVPDQLPTPTITPAQWIEKNLPAGATLGLHAWVHTPGELKAFAAAASGAGGTLRLLAETPVDKAWANRPASPLTPSLPHPLEFAGKPSDEKRADVATALKDKGANTLAIMVPEEICWLLNVRGNDVPCTPFTLSYALARDNGTVDWFVDQRKIPDETRAWVGPDVRIHDFTAFPAALAEAAKAGTVWLDPARATVGAQAIIKDNGGNSIEAESPIQMMKAQKNAVEIARTIETHIKDGTALTRFIAAVRAPGAAERLNEYSAARLQSLFRSKAKDYRGPSFATISGAGPNGAIMHYRPTREDNKPLLSGPTYLNDSGGQYPGGTTDVTRTIAVDPPNVPHETKDRFTRVLQGHIRVAMAEFADDTPGKVLDALARSALREVKLDFAHATGHGVGSYLSVHEGPCYFATWAERPLVPGVVISNEPGFYQPGGYGIRIESLLLTVDTGRTNDEGKRLLGFKTLTMAPIDRDLILPEMLKPEERRWLDTYHAEVRATLLPEFEKTGDTRAIDYLKTATAPLLVTASVPSPPGRGLG